MSAYQDLDRTLAAWFAEEDPRTAPDGLLALVLTATSRHRPARRWMASLRVPSDTATVRRSRPFAMAALGALLLAVVLIVVAVFGAAFNRDSRIVVPASASPGPTAHVQSTPGITPSPSDFPTGSPIPTPSSGPTSAPTQPVVSESPRASISPSASLRALVGPNRVAFAIDDPTGATSPQLWLAEPDGSNARVVLSGWLDGWSPTGNYLLAGTGGRMKILDAAGNVVGDVPGGDVAWVPGHDQILDIVNPASHNGVPPTPVIRLYRHDGTLIRRIPTPDGVNQLAEPSWSPDGGQFVASGCEGCLNGSEDDTSPQAWDLWVVAADGSGATKITHTPGENEAGPQWLDGGPGTGKIVFWIACGVTLAGCPDGPNDTWSVGTQGGAPQRILQDVQYAIPYRDDSTRLLYAKNIPQGGYRIFSALPDGSDARQLTFTPGSDSQPTFVRSGSIAYAHQDPNAQQTQVFVAPANGSQGPPGGADGPHKVGTDWSGFAWQP